MAKVSYLELHKKWKHSGLPDYGLCATFSMTRGLKLKELRLFRPTRADVRKYARNTDPGWWASGTKHVEPYRYTRMRQTIMLFLAAMNGEL